MPAVTPVATPVAAPMNTTGLEEDQVPPGAAEASVVLPPTQMVVVPVMAAGTGSTETAIVVIQPVPSV